MDSSPKFLTIDGFTARFGIGRTATYCLLGEGTLHAVKVGRRTLIDCERAEAWLASLPDAAIQCRRPARRYSGGKAEAA